MTLQELWDQHVRNHRALMQVSAEQGGYDGYAMNRDLDRLAVILARTANDIQLWKLYQPRRLTRRIA